jgi:hypothetical protein
MCPRPFPLALAAVVLLAAAAPAPASEALRGEIRAKLAVPIQKLLAEENRPDIAVGEFIGPAQLDTNGGPGIQQLLTEELVALKVLVRKEAELSVRGRYAKVEDSDHPGHIAVKVTAEVFDKRDERRGEFPALVRGVADIARVLGATADLPRADETNAGRRRHQELERRLNRPSAHLAGSKVSASADSPYAVELVVKATPESRAEPRAARLEDGQAFVEIKRHEVYEIRIYNGTDDELGVTISIDGIDVFAFSELRNPKTGGPKYTRYVISPHRGQTVVGWHLRDRPPDNYLSFLVTEYGKGASSRAVTRARGKRGVITVTFAPAYKGKPRSAADETGFGPPRSVRVEPVRRSFGPLREVVSIRYTR